MTSRRLTVVDRPPGNEANRPLQGPLRVGPETQCLMYGNGWEGGPSILGEIISRSQSARAALRRCFSAFLALVLTLSVTLVGGPNARAQETRTAVEPTSLADKPSLDERANQLADEVLASDEFWWRRTEKVSSPSFFGSLFGTLYDYLIAPVFDTIGKFIRTILDWLFSQSADRVGGDWSSGIPFLWAVVAALGAVVAWRVIVLLRQRQSTDPVATEETAVDELPQAEQLLEQAQTALAQGERRDAIRLAFLALIALLQDRGKLAYDPSRSNREYQRDLRRWPDLLAGFRAAADPFERCWYGGRQPEAAEVDSVISLCRQQLLITAGER